MTQPRSKAFFSTIGGIALTGCLIGVVGAVLQKAGNPPNMGLCIACFERDIAGALGLHRFAVAQYIRPLIVGMVWGALLAALLFREFRPRAGSAPMTRFLLAVFAMVGVLAFMGCPWRVLFRLAGGDLNAVVGLIGLACGAGAGARLVRAGFHLGSPQETRAVAGWVFPLLMLSLLVPFVFRTRLVEAGPITFSETGPGAMHAPFALSLLAGGLIGFLAQRTRFCTVGAFGNLVRSRNAKLLVGVIGVVLAAFVANLMLGQVRFGFVGQPIAHSNVLWNFLGMALCGLAFTLAGGCPGRQLVLAGEGDSDAGVFTFGMFVGAALCHNLRLAAAPDKIVADAVQVGGLTASGMGAVVLGLAVCLVLGLAMRKERT